MCSDDHHGRVGVERHDPTEIVQPFAAVRGGALKIEIEQNRIRPLALHDRQKLGGGRERLHALEHVPQSETRGERDIGIVVDDYGQLELVFHATSVAPLSGNEQYSRRNSAIFDWHGACSDRGDGNSSELHL